MPYRIAAAVLEQFLPVDTGNHPETLHGHTLKRGADLVDTAAAEPATAAPAITLTVDSTYIRSYEDSHRHLEVRLGNVETAAGARQVFAAVAKTDTQIEALIRRSLKEMRASRWLSDKQRLGRTKREQDRSTGQEGTAPPSARRTSR